MDEVLWKYKRIERVALVNGVLVIRLQLIERYDVPDGEEDERGGEQQRQHIAEGCEREGHGGGSGPGAARGLPGAIIHRRGRAAPPRSRWAMAPPAGARRYR